MADPKTLDPAADEFRDYEGGAAITLRSIDWRRIAEPETVRGLAAFIIGVVVLTIEHTPMLLADLIGFALLVVAFFEALSMVFGWRRRTGSNLARLLTLTAFGGVLVGWPDATLHVLSRLLGIGLLTLAAYTLGRSVAQRAGTRAFLGRLVQSALIALLGVALLLAPEQLLVFVVVVMATVWAIAGVATVAVNLRADRSHTVGVGDSWSRFTEWVEYRPHTADDRTQLYRNVFFEGPNAQRRLSRFLILMGLATTIASWGIIADSTAVVIGAMLVAPLMVPLMGTSLSLAMGWPRRASISALVALGGIALAIGLSYAIGFAAPFGSVESSSQIASRVSPTLTDLFVAIAAGTAGAFALSRPDVSDALPGVAVAIALVPPLAVVGITAQAGDTAGSEGALLLFTTNLVAILLTGAVVFILTGVVPLRLLAGRADRVRASLGLVALLGVVIAVVLSASSEHLSAQAFDHETAGKVSENWVGTRDLQVSSVEVGPDAVDVVVVGPDEPASVDSLGSDLASALQRPVDVVVRWVPESEFRYRASDA